MFSIVRLSLFGAVCFIAGTLAVASAPFAPHDGDDDLPIRGTTCHNHGCAQSPLPALGAIPAPTVLDDKCSAYDTSNDKSQLRTSDKFTHLINIAGRSAYGFSPPLNTASPTAKDTPADLKKTYDVTGPYVFVVVEHCTEFEDNKQQVTTQIIRVPWRHWFGDPTVETIRTSATDAPPSFTK